jgi:hypothetical protein
MTGRIFFDPILKITNSNKTQAGLIELLAKAEAS